ncbi:pectate lyase superfamily protein-domain-containing protein [Podospora appendiculata]|uniref:Pectate lyase superfamily protein-domain-containing protein n=1 Tax=Podospora appendiculata TaxID=314037 RepID=A0AAE0XC66_9PEZI|nr:pectate lyase superfamily protein-domain-containing protein [Podospora appendiculata]
MPLAPSGYQFFRNVKDFGATGDGTTDDTAAINRAASAFSSTNSSIGRCGKECASTSYLGAIVYFPPGTYIVSTPIIQYFFTQFIGDPNSKPVIKGSANFTGIALIDTDVYIPNGNGAQWYINQNQFLRQIRNFKIDLTAMPRSNTDNGQTYVPTGIHWQVAQATSLQNIDFVMPVSDSTGSTTAVGIFMENGSGGFLSDLTFFGGNIGFRAGTQQYTARGLTFTSCLTAISMIWDWGFTWKDIYVFSTYVAIDCTSVGGTTSQGTGSISVLDSHFNYVPYPITLRSGGPYPNILLDNLLVENSASVVLISGGATIFPGSSSPIHFTSWAMGNQYTSISGRGGPATGFVNPAPVKPPSLLDGTGRIFTRSRPQYANVAAGGFVVVTAHGIANDGTGDQTSAINSLLASSVGTPVFFPAGIYQVQGTVNVPLGSIIVGHHWSQIRGTGSYFGDANNPKVMVKVGNKGDSGVIEISDMLFTVKGPTAGAILMEWNVHESSQGSAAMWDSHFRVGGAAGSNLQLANCPRNTANTASCMAATMLLHVTSQASGYFENVWAWVADHDLDNPLNAQTSESNSGVPLGVQTSVTIYAARGILIESQGPCWFYGTASEHAVMYQYQLYNAQNIFFGHMQTETPYFQSTPDGNHPFPSGQFPDDPQFGDCQPGSSCAKAWALRVINSKNILIYGAGFYSFFQDWDQGCIPSQSCQTALIETSYSQSIWIYNLFTIGATEMVTPRGGIPPTLQADNQAGFTTEVAVWLVLATGGGNLGGDGGSQDGSGIVYIDPTIFVHPSPTVECWPPCTLVFPPSTMPSVSTIKLPPLKTTITVNSITTITTTLVIPDGRFKTPPDHHRT